MVRRDLQRRGMDIRTLPQHLSILGALVLGLCLIGLLGAAGSKQAHALEPGAYKPGQVIVKLAVDPTQPPLIEKVEVECNAVTLDNYFSSIGIYLLQTPDNEAAEACVTKLTDGKPENGEAIYAEKNFLAEAPEEDPVGDARMRARGISSTSESKEGSADREAARNLRLSCAAQLENSRGKGVKVAVLDTGAQLRHPALEANFEGVFERGKDYDFVSDDTNPSEPRRGSMVGHGTHVAGIVDRVAPAAKIMPLRVLNARGSGNVYTIAKAISFAQRNDANVVNLSLGTSSHSELLEEIIKTAIKNGIVVVAAAGNLNTEAPHYPAAGDETLPVASTDGLIAVTSVTYTYAGDKKYDKKSWFANYGLWVDIAAPGEGIRSAFPVDQYANWSGTSMATPFVSGQAALIHKRYPALEPAGIGGIEAQIRNSAREFNPDPNDLESVKLMSLDELGRSKLGDGHADVCASLL
jgi:thermitase